MKSLVKLLAGPHQHIDGGMDVSQCREDLLRVTNLFRGPVRDYDHQVVVAVRAGIAPGHEPVSLTPTVAWHTSTRRFV